MSKSDKTCCICSRTFTGYGNNPWPTVSGEFLDKNEDACCCDRYNSTTVVPARMLVYSFGAKTPKEAETIAAHLLAAPRGTHWDDVREHIEAILEEGRAV
jgi:hypothetical protein